MDAKKELLGYKKIVDRKLAEYFAKKMEEARRVGPSTVQMVKSIRDLTLAGGKRLRAALMYWGYVGAGGKEFEKIIETSMSVELIHIFLLIHDDIIDRDDFRHGIPTVHKKYQKLSRVLYKKTETEHFGTSLAIVVGDMAYSFGNEIVFGSRFAPEKVLAALKKLQSVVSLTVSGEVFDIILEAKGKASEKEILEVHKNKTAKYTVEGPLILGAMLAEANQNILKACSDYAVPVGIAFQIQDDILGVFGDEKKLGKPVCSDLREGKQTLLIAKALENGGRAERKIIDNLLGNKNVTVKEIEIFRNIVRETGSLEYSQSLAKNLVEKGKKSLAKSGMCGEAKEFLTGIADYIVSREV